MHWSSAIMMSLPMAFCVSMLRSGRELHTRTVHVASEHCALLVVDRKGAPHPWKRKNLEAARVRQHGLLPAVEAMDSAKPLEDFDPGPEHQADVQTLRDFLK